MYDVELKCSEVLKRVDIWMCFREEVYIVGETSGEVFSLLQGEATSVPCEEWYSHVSVCNGGFVLHLSPITNIERSPHSYHGHSWLDTAVLLRVTH